MAVKNPPVKGKTGAVVGGEKMEGAEKEVKNKGTARVAGRKMLYPKVTVCGVEIPREARIMTVRGAKNLLGWITEEEFAAEETKGMPPEVANKVNTKFGDDYFLKDLQGNLVQLRNNVANRPYDHARALGHAQDVLKRNWQFNGESWIVGCTGLTLSCQHRAIGFVLAYQMLTEDSAQGEHWRKVWGWVKKGEGYAPGANGHPFEIEALVVFGIDESAEVTRTIDNVKPRTLSDILFADTSIFGKKNEKEKLALSKMTEYALKVVWDRTGAKNDAYSPKRTHSESVDFILNHRNLIECVNHIHTENAESAITKLVSTGTAAGLCFLMACSTQDAETSAQTREKWFQGKELRQTSLDFANKEKAFAFWGQVGNTENKDFDGVRKALAALKNPNTGAMGPTSHKVAVLVNAWNEFVVDGSMTAANCKPEFVKDGDDIELKSMPSVGGVDDPIQPDGKRLSAPVEEEVPTDVEVEGGDEEVEDDGPSEEEIAEIEAAKAAARAKKK